MKKSKVVRGLLWSLAVLAAGLGGVYLLRWPLFEGTVRAKLAELVAKELKSDADVATLEGSLLSSITARGITLRPKGNAPIRSATAEQVRVVYGFLGSGEPTLTVDRARIVLAAKEGPALPLQETIRDVVSVLRSVRFSGVVRARNVDVVLPDGRVLSLGEGSLDHATWALTLRTEGFGKVEGSATLRLDGSFSFVGSASEGPLRSVRINLGAGRDRCPLSLSADLLGHALTWTGAALFEAERLTRAEGDLAVKEGRAHTVADLASGKVEADVDAVLNVNEELKGDLALTGHVEGPIAGPPDAWTLREGAIKVRGATFRTVPVDKADIELFRSSLAEVAFRGAVRSGEDHVEAEGRFRWKAKPDLEATVHARAANLAACLTLLPEPLPLKASQVRVDGKLSLHDGAASFDGAGSTGAGSYESITWKGATFSGSFAPARLEVRQGSLMGTDYAPAIGVSGKIEGESVLLHLRAGTDEIDIGGRRGKGGDFEGRIR
ncbi:MAG TPA: hypothetical protein VG457_08725, partial [Planctomycetota bacterium]|nr:hypothetical protein [Planctomycetota bacterium]